MKKKKKQKEKKKKKKEKEKEVEEIISEVRNMSDNDSDAEEDDFWTPPVGDRWDFDDGGDRWGSGSGSESGQESDEVNETGMFCLYFKLKLCYFVIDESLMHSVNNGPSRKLLWMVNQTCVY